MWKRIHGKIERNLRICQHAWLFLTSPPVEQRPKHHSQPPKSHPGRKRVEGGTSIHLWKCSKQQNPAVESENQTSENFQYVKYVMNTHYSGSWQIFWYPKAPVSRCHVVLVEACGSGIFHLLVGKRSFYLTIAGLCISQHSAIISTWYNCIITITV